MPKNLLIVESPAKAKTIKKYLGPDFEILASVGHVKDLPVNKLGVDIEHGFQPEYVTIKGKSKILSNLKRVGKHSDAVYLAPDPDREGEAIAWHIARELESGNRKIFRVLFNELTAKAIREAVSNPQELNQDKFESQQARRILDRLVGYQLSPLLWSRVKRGLSAGRVQSVALRMICDREREIHAFDPKEYWSITAHLDAEEPPTFEARFSKFKGNKLDLNNEEETSKIVSEVNNKTFEVANVLKKKKKKNPPPPFITSLLQQEAFRKLRFSAKRTMSIAQGLYEGVSLGDRGQVGLITYMRTDSFRVSDDAISQARDYIPKSLGSEYLPEKANRYKSRKGAQEAHEAIRPTSVELEPKKIAPHLTKDQLALYTLIWNRFVASQMKPAIINQTQVDIKAGEAIFKASGSIVVFEGFTTLYQEVTKSSKAKNEKERRLPPLKNGQVLKLIKLDPMQHFTQPPRRFSEATLIKALEEKGIGRPSTYASILANISGREYVSMEKRRFKPTELGFLVTDLLVKNFPDILDAKFTAFMENNLDRIENGKATWTKVLEDFYATFQNDLEKAKDGMKGEVTTDINCSKCGKPMSIKSGKNGVFLACSGYPECRNTTNYSRDEKGRVVMETVPEIDVTGIMCEKCGKEMVVKKGRYGPFLACFGYPDCKNTRDLVENGISNEEEKFAGTPCKVCGARMLVKINRSGQRFLACEKYPKCTHTESLNTNVPCPKEGCEGTLVERASKKGRKFYACNRYPKCRFVMWDEPFEGTCPECGTSVFRIKRPKGSDHSLVCRKKGCDFSKTLPDA